MTTLIDAEHSAVAMPFRIFKINLDFEDEIELLKMCGQPKRSCNFQASY